MAYFIGNGAATIGGGSLGRTEQLPTLKLLCVDLCARHLERLSNLGDMPTEVFIDLLKRAKGKATPDVVQRLQDQNERLVKLLAEAESTPSKEWSRQVMEILKALGDIPSSVGLLKDTLIAKVVAPLRKNTDQQIARAASAFEQPSKTEVLPVPGKGKTDYRGGGGCNSGTGSGNGNGKGVGQRSPAEEKQLKHLEMLKIDKVRASSKRAREAREREQQKRPKLIFGKTKGEDFSKNAARSSRNGAPTFSSSSATSARGFFSPPSQRASKHPAYGSSSTSGGKRSSREDITSVSELRQSVVIGQRLSTPIVPGQRTGAAAAAAAASRSAKRNTFWQ
eukprot:jgi/Undpi1/13219/HiC_scaffold_8.g02881.m1